MFKLHSITETRFGSVAVSSISGIPYEFTSPFEGDEFAILIWVFDEHVGSIVEPTLPRLILREGCRYAVCAGHDCETWDDSIDWVYLDLLESRDDAGLVMTTWHDDESPDEVASFFMQHTSFDDFQCDKRLVVCVGGEEADWEALLSAIDAEVAPEREEPSSHVQPDKPWWRFW